MKKMLKKIGAPLGALTAVTGGVMFISPNESLPVVEQIFWFAVAALVATIGWLIYRASTKENPYEGN